MTTDESLFSCDKIAREVAVDVILCDYVGGPATKRAISNELPMTTEKQPALTHRKDVKPDDLSDSDLTLAILFGRLSREKQKDILGLLTADEEEAKGILRTKYPDLAKRYLDGPEVEPNATE